MHRRVRVLWVVFVSVLFFAPALLMGQSAGPVALVGGTLIDGTGAPPVKDAVVLMQGGKIVGVVRGRAAIPAGAKVIDVGGKYVLPGLIDAHVHLASLSMRGKYNEAYGKDLLEAIAKNARAHLLSGVTTVFDVGGAYHELKQIRDEINAGKRVGARIFMAGPIIWNDRGQPIPAPRSPAEALHQQRLLRGEFVGVEGAREKVRELVRLGVDHIKVYQTGGTDQGYAGYATRVSPQELVAIVEEATKAGLSVTAHTRGVEGCVNGVKVGLKALHHVVYMGIPVPDETVRLLAESPVYIVPTLVAFTAVANTVAHPEVLEEARQALELPKEAVEDLFKYAIDPAEYTREPHYREGYAEIELGMDGLKRLIAAKARIAMGTDAGTLANFHGTSYREVEAMVEVGMTPTDAIVASTRNPALAYGRSELGTVEVGKLADVIVVEGDPLADIRNLRNVVKVFKGGEEYK